MKTPKFSKNFKTLSSAVALLLSSISAYAGPLGYNEGRWIFKAKEAYFSSNTNYNRSGTEVSLPSNGYLQTYTTSLSLTHDMSNKLSLYTVVDLVYGKSRDSQFERTRLAPTDFKIGADYLLLSTFVDVVPELQMTIPIQRVNEDTDDVILGEGTTETRIGAYVSKNMGWLSGYGYLGYAFRTGGRSTLMPYEIQALTDFDGFQLNLGLWGYYTIADDSNINTPTQRDNVTARVNGGSLRFYSVSPSLHEAGGSLGLPVSDSMYARLGVSTTLGGVRSAAGNTYWLSLSYTFGNPTLRQVYKEQKKEKEKTQEKKKQEFIPETYPEETAPYDENVKDIQIDAPPTKLQKPGTSEVIQRSKGAPVEVKLRSAKPKKKKRSQ